MKRPVAIVVIVGGVVAALIGGTAVLLAFAKVARVFSRAHASKPVTTTTARAPERRATTPQDLAVWILDDSTKVRPGADLGLPRAAGAAPIRLEAARGETVAFQVALASAQPSRGVRIHVDDLAGAHGAIPRRRIEAFLEWFVDCPAVEEKAVGLPAGEYPDALLPLWEGGPDGAGIASPFPLAAKRNNLVWVDVRVPRDAAAGRYVGRIVIDADPFPRTELPLELTVYPFAIDTQSHLPAWVPLYATRLYDREGLNALPQAERTAVIHAYFKMAREHGFVTQIMEDQPQLRWNEATGELLSADWTAYDALYGPVLDGRLFEDHEPPRVWKVGGFIWWGARRGDPPNFGGDYRRDAALTPAHRRALIEYAREIERHFEAKGWTRSQLFLYMIDEPKFSEYPNNPSLVRSYGEAIHASGTKIRHLVTIAPHDNPTPIGAVDIWSTWGAGYRPDEMRTRQQQGERAWFYQQHEPFVGGHCINNDGLGLRSWPWIAWRYGVDGIFLWVGNFWEGDPYRNALNWDDTLLGNGILFYPGHLLPTLGYPPLAGPVPSFRMKALRRGLQDYEYFHLLKSLGGDPDRWVAKIIRSALNEKAWDPYWNHPRWAKPGDWSHEPADWDAARRSIAAEIERRQAAS